MIGLHRHDVGLADGKMGDLAVVGVAVSIFFAGIPGSGPADTAARLPDISGDLW